MEIAPKRRKSVTNIIRLAMLVIPLSSNAGTVEQVSVAEMMAGSELVIHGEVVDRSYAFGDDTTQIYTSILIRVIDVIKGNTSDEIVELRFLGGTNGRLNLVVSDQFVPPVGDEAVYFIENLDRSQVNPLYGWRQGHFPVRHDEFGKNRHVLTHDLRPIYEVSEKSTPFTFEVTDGTATGVGTENAVGRAPLSLVEFKQRLRDLMENFR